MSLATTKLFLHLLERGNANKARRKTVDRTQVLVMEEVASQDWFEQAIVTETRIKAFFSMAVHLELRFIQTLTEEQYKEEESAALLLNVAKPAEATRKMAATESHSEIEYSNDTFIKLQRIQEAIEEKEVNYLSKKYVENADLTLDM